MSRLQFRESTSTIGQSPGLYAGKSTMGLLADADGPRAPPRQERRVGILTMSSAASHLCPDSGHRTNSFDGEGLGPRNWLVGWVGGCLGGANGLFDGGCRRFMKEKAIPLWTTLALLSNGYIRRGGAGHPTHPPSHPRNHEACSVLSSCYSRPHRCRRARSGDVITTRRRRWR